MNKFIICRYGEISLKGRNRNEFESVLVENIKIALRRNNIAFGKITKPRGRIIIETENECSILQKVFGLISFSHAELVEHIEEKALEIVKDLGEVRTFRISVQRLDKSYPINSSEIEKGVGAYVCDNTSLAVSLKNFDINICIEIIDKKAYMFTDKIKCVGGLPEGVQGSVVCLIEDLKSIYAAILMIKRGCTVIPVGFNEFDCSLIDKYGLKSRKFQKINTWNDAPIVRALVVNQGYSNLKDLYAGMVVLRPLLGYDLDELKQVFA